MLLKVALHYFFPNKVGFGCVLAFLFLLNDCYILKCTYFLFVCITSSSSFFSISPLLPIEDIYTLPSSKSDEESVQPSEPADEFE